MDWVIVAAVLLILGIGILTLYSLSLADPENLGNIFQKQLIFAVVGLAVMFFLSFANYHYFIAYSKWIYFATILVLLIVALWSTPTRGTAGWIGWGVFKFQPVEMTKLALIVFLASFISKKKNELTENVRVVASLVMTSILVFLVLKQPDLGSAIILIGIWIGMILVSGINRKTLLVLGAIGVLVIGSSWFFLAEYQKARVLNLFQPESDPQGTGYNVIQAIVAVGSGGFAGKGIGHGSQSQLNFLPEKHTDFIFAVTAEELGITGILFILALYGLIMYRIKKIAQFSEDNFGYLLASGVMVMLFLQLAINVGMNIGIMPVTGITLPLLSYGGSSLVSFLASVGIVLNISKRQNVSAHRSVQSY